MDKTDPNNGTTLESGTQYLNITKIQKSIKPYLKENANFGKERTEQF